MKGNFFVSKVDKEYAYGLMVGAGKSEEKRMSLIQFPFHLTPFEGDVFEVDISFGAVAIKDRVENERAFKIKGSFVAVHNVEHIVSAKNEEEASEKLKQMYAQDFRKTLNSAVSNEIETKFSPNTGETND